MIDTHSHIDSEQFDIDRDETIQRAFDSGVTHIIIPAISPLGYTKLLNITDKYTNIYNGIGVHPHNANETNAQVLEHIYEISKLQKTVAIGETGLDYYYDFSPKEKQIDSFRSQINIAKETKLPMIIHNREADEDILNILEKEQDGSLKGVLHCFSSTEKELERALDLGFNISFTGNITFKKSVLTPVIEKTPIDKILLETDSPYMTPVPFRGKRNEPSYVIHIAKKISEIKSISLNEVINMTTQNAKELFKIALFIIFLFSTSSFLYAQTDDDDYYDYYDEYDYVHPFEKTFGIGIVFGTNTVVENYLPDDQYISYPGLFSFGGILSYYPTDIMNLQFTYLYARNTEISDKFENVKEPSRYHLLELTSTFSPNPYNRISFYGLGGASLLYSVFYDPDIDAMDDRTQFALNAGLGFDFNLDMNSYGIIQFFAEWKLNFIFGKQNFETDPRARSQEPVDVGIFMSIPRFGIIWYPI